MIIGNGEILIDTNNIPNINNNKSNGINQIFLFSLRYFIISFRI